MNKFTIPVIASLALLLCQGCDKNTHAVFAPDELGMPQHEYYIAAGGEDFNIDYLSNKEGTVSLLDPADESWAQPGSSVFEGTDGSLPVHVLPNDGFRRRADILFTTDTRRDTVTVFQHGAIDDTFFFSENTVIVLNGTGGNNSVDVDIKVPLDEIGSELHHFGDVEWVSDCQLTATKFTFKTTDNQDPESMRRAIITFTYLDGWERQRTIKLTILQARADNVIGTVYSFDQLRSSATVSGYHVPENTLVEGYIVSTTEGGNAGDAQVEDYKQGTGVIEYSINERTAYLESFDGKYGS